ncbi:hypothetical protein PsorP6_011544 [Peronosclerospora sorghi]|uniref:Uncharacterized protein n=1 Tax=Peronosclerospora sorghi TaxID=230839 RepID=A0ACC0WI91_9STRA|nr:hypothetical protein PsorP6_011544 [Peronosclerospora sorghi]
MSSPRASADREEEPDTADLKLTCSVSRCPEDAKWPSFKVDERDVDGGVDDRPSYGSVHRSRTRYEQPQKSRASRVSRSIGPSAARRGGLDPTSERRPASSSSPRRALMHAFQCTQLVAWRPALRFLFLQCPHWVLHRLESTRTIVSFFFVYVMLQALAILWGFLFNVGAVLGENMSTIVTIPVLQAMCLLGVYVSVMGMALSLGRATWIITWQSRELPAHSTHHCV